MNQPPAALTVSLVVPVLNNEPRLEEVLREINSVLGDRPEVIVVYDVTRPEFMESIRAEQADLESRYGVRCVTRTDRRGFGSALRAGFEASTGDVMIPIMGDCSDDIAEIPRMLERIEAGADLVAGARYIPGGAIIGETPKQQISRVYSKIIKSLSSIACDDVSNSFRAYRRSIWENIDNQSNSFDISVEMTVKAAARGYRLDQVPAVWTNRAAGQSQFSMLKETTHYGRWLLYAVRHTPSWRVLIGVPAALISLPVLAVLGMRSILRRGR
jgi:dolichol-phosphate mannosyltransferase